MLTSLTTRILIALCINVALLSFAPDGHAYPCECKDIGAITAEIQRVSTGEEIWKEIYGWSRGLLEDVAKPKSNDELNTKFLQLARAPRTDWRRIIREPVEQVEKPQTAGGLDSNGEPVVDDDYAKTHCDMMVRGVQTHEFAHTDFYTDPVNATFATRTQLLRLRAEAEVVSYRAHKKYLVQKLEELEKKCHKLSFKGVTIDCTIRTPACVIRTGQRLAGSVCGDPLKETWTITPHYFAEGCGAPSNDTRGDKPFDNDCVQAGSDEEKRRAAIYAKARGMSGGGWMCVYSDGPRPKITIRSFRLPMCQGAAEQTVTVDAVVSKNCDEPSSPPATPTAPPTSRPNS